MNFARDSAKASKIRGRSDDSARRAVIMSPTKSTRVHITGTAAMAAMTPAPTRLTSVPPRPLVREPRRALFPSATPIAKANSLSTVNERLRLSTVNELAP